VDHTGSSTPFVPLGAGLIPRGHGGCIRPDGSGGPRNVICSRDGRPACHAGFPPCKCAPVNHRACVTSPRRRAAPVARSQEEEQAELQEPGRSELRSPRVARAARALVVRHEAGDDDHRQREHSFALERPPIRPEQQRRPTPHQRGARSHAVREFGSLATEGAGEAHRPQSGGKEEAEAAASTAAALR
jgi:hypothetical protein